MIRMRRRRRRRRVRRMMEMGDAEEMKAEVGGSVKIENTHSNSMICV